MHMQDQHSQRNHTPDAVFAKAVDNKQRDEEERGELNVNSKYYGCLAGFWNIA